MTANDIYVLRTTTEEGVAYLSTDGNPTGLSSAKVFTSADDANDAAENTPGYSAVPLLSLLQ